MTSDPSLSIVIPLYNQKENIPRLFSELDRYLKEHPSTSAEVVLVNDGSTDESHTLLTEQVARFSHPVRLMSYNKNRGRGYAVRTGVLASSGAWVVVMDPDLAASFTHIDNIFNYIHDYDVIIGSRRILGAEVVTPPSPTRWVLGMGFIIIARAITRVPVSDFSCGFKCYSRNAAQLIFPQTKINRWAHDAEILYLAKKFGLAIYEIPLRWTNGRGTSVRIVTTVALTLYDLTRLRFLHRTSALKGNMEGEHTQMLGRHGTS